MNKDEKQADLDTADLPVLPKGWCWATLGQLLARSQNGFGKRRHDQGTPSIVLRLADIQKGEASLADPRRVNATSEEVAKYGLAEDAIIAIRANGSPDLVGRFIRFTVASEPVLFCDHFIQLRFQVAELARYVRLIGDTATIRHFVEENKVSSAGQNTISQASLERLQFPLPPLNEQRRIVAKIEELFSDLDAGVAALERAKAKLKRYRAAVLKAAVEGKLTAQWRAEHVDAASCRVLEASRESAPTAEAASCRFPDGAPGDSSRSPAPSSTATDELRLDGVRGTRQDAPTRQDAASTGENPAADDTLPLVGYFDPFEPVANLQGNLPHWRQEGATYFVTFRLADSIPPQKLDLWQRERDEWLRRHPPPHSKRQREEYFRLFVHRLHQWLDAGYGKCVLAQPAVRKIAVDALRCFEKDRYLLREWVVMPNHAHAVVTPLPGYELSSVIHSWKSYTAKEINKHLGRKGTLWQKESFDHIVRGPDELDRIERYIHDNPRLLPADRFTLHCLHEHPPVEAASCRFPDGAPGDSFRSPAPSSTAADGLRVDGARGTPQDAQTRQDAASTGETGAELLKRILKERRCCWEQEQLAAYQKAGKKPPPNWQQKYKEPAGPDESSLPALPEGWCWATLEQINLAERPMSYGVLQPGPDLLDGVPFVRVCDVAEGKVAVEQLKRISPAISNRYQRTVLQGGEVLLTIVGTIGRTAVAPDCLRGANTARAVAVIPVSRMVSPRYVEIALRENGMRSRLTQAAHEVARKTLNLEDVRIACIPFAPPQEQEQIVTQIEGQLSLVQKAEAQIDADLKRSARLRQSILKRAFEGKLVPQDPSDEPARVLLERIKADKANGAGRNQSHGEIVEAASCRFMGAPDGDASRKTRGKRTRQDAASTEGRIR